MALGKYSPFPFEQEEIVQSIPTEVVRDAFVSMAAHGCLQAVRWFQALKRQDWAIQVVNGQALLKAVKNNHLGVVDRFLELGVGEGPGQISKRILKYAFYKATQWGHLEIVNRFLELGFGEGSGQISTSSLGDAFTEATENGHLAVVDRFLELGFGEGPGQISTSSLGDALERAVRKGYFDVANRFLNLGVGEGPGQIKRENIGKVLQLAVKEQRLFTVNRLLEFGVGKEPAQISREDLCKATMIACLNDPYQGRLIYKRLSECAKTNEMLEISFDQLCKEFIDVVDRDPDKPAYKSLKIITEGPFPKVQEWIKGWFSRDMIIDAILSGELDELASRFLGS